MSIDALKWAKDQEAGSPGAKLVLLVLADYADEHGVSWPSKRKLAKVSEQNPRTIQRHLQHLQKIGLIIVDARSMKDGRQTSNGYRLPLDRMSPGGGQNV